MCLAVPRVRTKSTPESMLYCMNIHYTLFTWFTCASNAVRKLGADQAYFLSRLRDLLLVWRLPPTTRMKYLDTLIETT
jgi:hypothetical protein